MTGIPFGRFPVPDTARTGVRMCQRKLRDASWKRRGHRMKRKDVPMEARIARPCVDQNEHRHL
jgi:hypothetical protein